MDSKSSQMILVGYYLNSGYKLFNPVNKQVVISRDVITYELKEWNLTKNVKKDSMRILCDEPTNEAGREVLQATRKVRQEVVEGQVSISIPQRNKNIHSRLQECVITSDDVVDDESELIHYAFYADTEPVNAAEAFKESRWIKAMMDEVKCI